MAGSPSLLTQVSALIEKNYTRKVSPSEELLITAGATQAIFTTILALVNKGDEVIILDPSYDCYEPAIILAGGIPIRISLNEDFLPNWDVIEKSVNQSTRMIITNNPHNPSGRVWAASDMEKLETLVKKMTAYLYFPMRFMNLFLLSQNIFRHMKVPCYVIVL